MATATLRDVWPTVSRVHDGPQSLLDEVRRLYTTLRSAPKNQHAAIEDQIHALAEAYKRTPEGQATTNLGMAIPPSRRTP